MMTASELRETMMEIVLVVDDEDGVRRTFAEWLAGMPGIQVFACADAEAALTVANEHRVDLAVLDWNLGSGSDGLRLLEDLVDFQPEIVAILVTGFANQATPLDALRMGVRDYLDKNHDLTRETFLAAIRKQLDRIIPAKRQRELNIRLGEFRAAVDQVLPLVRGSAALNDPLPLPQAINSLFRFLLRATATKQGALIARSMHVDGTEQTVAYSHDGQPLPLNNTPFRQTLAATVVSLQEPCVMTDFSREALGTVELQPFEQNRTSILAAPVRVAAGLHVVLELFDKPSFFAEDRQLLAATSDIASELLRQSLAERQTHRLLFDAVEAALRASEHVSNTLPQSPTDRPPAAAVLASIRTSLTENTEAVTDADTGIRLIEAVRSLAIRHGAPAVDHCVKLVEGLRVLLDQTHG